MGTIDAPLDENATYSLLLSQHAGLNQILTEKFPNSLIFPAFGNNDPKYHDNPQPAEDAAFFYDYIFNLWFELQPSNLNGLTQA